MSNEKIETLTFGEIVEHNNITATIIDDDMREVIKAVKHTGKQGTIQAKITFTCDRTRAGDHLVVKIDHSSNVPKLPNDSLILFADEDGHPSIDNPKQPKLDLGDKNLTDTPKPALRSVNNEE